MLNVKVCGMRDASNIDAVGRLLPALMGFIFYRRSPRYVDPESLSVRGLPASIGKVGVFVNEAEEEIVRIASKLSLDGVQLHGDEGPELCLSLREQIPTLSIIKAFRVGDGFSLSTLEPYRGTASHFLVDTASSSYGGSGKRFDWAVLSGYRGEVPLILSGGIGPEEIPSAIALAREVPLWGIDLNSRVEREPGLKSVERIKEVFDALHR